MREEGDLRLQSIQPQTSDQKRPQDTEGLLECRCKWGQMALSMCDESCRDRDPNEHFSRVTRLKVWDSSEEYYFTKVIIDIDVKSAYLFDVLTNLY